MSLVKENPSIISNNLIINGDLVSKGNIEIEGEIKGNITADLISIRESGKVFGDIKAKTIAYHKFNEQNSADGIIALLKQGKVVAVVSAFETKEETITKYWYRVYRADKITVYSRDNRSEVTEGEREILTEEEKDHNWGQVPVICYESNFSIIDKCASLVTAYQDLLNNVRNCDIISNIRMW